MVSPSAARPARTSETEARKSVAITGAPVSFSTPRTMAAAPCTAMSAPMRVNSGTCMKRFSKMVSVIIAAPSAVLISAMSCACRSVGNPGKGSVVTSTPLRRLARRETLMPFGIGAQKIERTAGDRRRHHISPGLDAVGDDAVRGAVQAFHPFDADAVGARAGDMRAHGVEADCELV